MKYFITGTGTDVGKTYVARLLCGQNGWKAMKPVSCGSEDEEILGCKPLYKFKLPASPHIAAKAENVVMDFDKIVAYCKNSGADIIEGAGGVMSPITETRTNLDLIKALDLPVILVAGTYLGTISHTLTALEVLKGREVILILSQTNAADMSELATAIKIFSGAQPVILKRDAVKIEITS